ncbi:hypothetical protein Ahu01nite_028850 [Winogradskya humida]|uniref:Uncharacterized protein n=1 Tax=Winogradskya humida TaxID=113566 RepID=A0ABQ3ZMK2_9ACTN|nr:hypothetical protein Ahu01nite_028850 [Actinoplanes humidus]
MRERDVQAVVIDAYARRAAVLRNGVRECFVILERFAESLHLIESQAPIGFGYGSQCAHDVARCVDLRVVVEGLLLAYVLHRRGVGGDRTLCLIELLNGLIVQRGVPGRREPRDIRGDPRPVEMLPQIQVRPLDELGEVRGVRALEHRGQRALLIKVIEHRLRHVPGTQDEDLAVFQVGDFRCRIRVTRVRVVATVLRQPRVTQQQNNGRLPEVRRLDTRRQLPRDGHLGDKIRAVQAVHRHDLGVAVLRLLDQRGQRIGNGRVADRIVDLGDRARLRHGIAVERIRADRQRRGLHIPVRPTLQHHPVTELPRERLHDQRPVGTDVIEEFQLLRPAVDIIDRGHQNGRRPALRIGQPRPRLGIPRLKLRPDIKRQIPILLVRPEPTGRQLVQRRTRPRRHDNLNRPVIPMLPQRIDQVHARRDMAGVRRLVDVDGKIGLVGIAQETVDLLLNNRRIRSAPGPQPNTIGHPAKWPATLQPRGRVVVRQVNRRIGFRTCLDLLPHGVFIIEGQVDR